MEQKKQSVLLLIDASALIHRFFHALPPFTGPAGQPTNALYGLCGVLLKILNPSTGSGRVPPDYAVAALDRPEPTFREQEYKEYKAQRPPTANELVSQIILMPEVFKKFGIKTLSVAGFEADDIIATITERYKKETGLKIVILSGDLDNLQLVENEKVVAEIFKTGITETKIYDEKAVIERYGLKPAQLPDYKGLVGDVSDNIPGVMGIGPKTAADLLKEFKTLEEVFENIAILTQKSAAKKLEGQKDIALASKRLATMRRDAPMEIKDLEELKASPLNKEVLQKFFQSLGFKSLVERLGK